MDGFGFIDLGVGVVIILSALLAYSRGLTREVTAIIGWIAAAALALVFADSARPLVRQIPTVGNFLGESCELLIVTSFVLVFALVLFAVSIIAPVIGVAVQRSFLAGIDQVLGFLFGVLRGFILIAVAFFLYKTLLPGQGIEIIETSRTAAVFDGYLDSIGRQNPQNLLDWVNVQYSQLILGCS